MKKLKVVVCVLILILVIAPVGVFGAESKDREIEFIEFTLLYNGVQIEQKGLRVIEKNVLPGVDVDHSVYIPIRTLEILKPDNIKVDWIADESRAIITATYINAGKMSKSSTEFIIGSSKVELFYYNPDWLKEYRTSWHELFEIFLYEGSTMISTRSASGFIDTWYDSDNGDGENEQIYHKNKLNLSDFLDYSRLDYSIYLDNGVNKDEWMAMQYLSKMDDVIIAKDGEDWNLSIIKRERLSANFEEIHHLLGNNFDLIYNSKEDMQLNCNGVGIKKVNGQYFLNKSDLIEIGFVDSDWKPLGERKF